MGKSAANEIRDKLPSWFRMKHDPNSVGWQLIEVIGRGIDEAGGLAQYASGNRYLSTASSDQPWVSYVARLPRICFEAGHHMTVTGEGRMIKLTGGLGEFLLAPVPDLGVPHLYQHDLGYIDRNDRALYLHRAYNASEEYPDGWVQVVVTGDRGDVVADFQARLTKQPLWTSLDELGILLSTPRLPDEDNESYRRRLMAAARLPGDGSKKGYVRALAKEFGLLKQYTWADGGRDFLIPHRHVNRETILVDWERPQDEDIIAGPNGQLALRGKPQYAGVPRTVVYAYGIRVLDLSDDTDPQVFSLLFDKEGFPTEAAVRLKEAVDRRVPVKWDYFVWGDAFWDGGSYALLPNMYDGKVDGFCRR